MGSVKTEFVRRHYGMPVYRIAADDGEYIELPPGLPNESRILSAVRAWRIGKIEEYDKSRNVDGFELDGKTEWLPLNTRLGFRRRLDSELRGGAETTTLWLDLRPITLPVQLASELIDSVERYAAACYDRTTAHKAAVMEMTEAEAILNYDHRAGYPGRPVIDTESGTVRNMNGREE